MQRSNLWAAVAVFAALFVYGSFVAGRSQPPVILAQAAATPPPPPADNVAHYAGCAIFTPGDWYNKPVIDAPVDPNSAAYIASMVQAGNTGGFSIAAPDADERVNIATAATPYVTVHQKVPYHSFPVPYPLPTPLYIEPLSDAHVMILQTHPCHLYEAYDTTYAGGMLFAYSGANWDLSKPFTPLPPGTPSSMASGLSIFAGMVKWEEVERGSVDHALNWGAPAGTVSQYGFVRPASDTDGLPFKGASSYELPYGAHLRLHASFDISHFGPQARAIAQAMKTYGIYLADTGCCNELYDADPAAGGTPWDKRDLAALDTIRITDFDVLALPPIQESRR